MDMWDFFFASLVGWSLHPGYLRKDSKAPTIPEMALMADKMVEESNGRLDRRSSSGS